MSQTEVQLIKSSSVVDGDIVGMSSSKLSGTLPALSAANLTSIPAANLTGTLPAISGANLTGISAGITEADSWRVTSNITGDAVPISSNWERSDTSPWEGKLGTGLTESSGVFTFPSTGFWFVIWHHYFYFNVASYWNEMAIELSNDSGSNWTQLGNSESALYSANGSTHWIKTTDSMLVDITNVSTQKMRFRIDVDNNSVTTSGSSTKKQTGFDIYRLGDT